MKADCCSKEEHKDCVHCSEFVSQFDCMRNAISNALDLIHRLQEDYSKLKERYVKCLGLNEKVIAKQKAEIERLTEELESYGKTINEASETIRKKNDRIVELQKQVYELKASREIEINELHEQHAIVAEEIKKDTAREIFTDLLKEFSIRKSCGNADVVVKEMAHNKGVEVE